MPYHTTKLTTWQGESLPYDPADVLVDIGSTGRANPWAELKLQASQMAIALQLLDEDAGQRMQICADRLWFRRHPETGKLTLETARFCRARLCPICQWRRSLKYAGQVFAIIQELARARANQHCKPYAWIMITFTMRNPSGPDLAPALDTIQAGWRKITRSKAWRKAIKGAIRSIEITYNAEAENYHPHIHILACVLPSYFSSRYYLSQAEWAAMWRDACGFDYTPQTEVHKVRPRKGQTEADGIWKAVAETMKYTCKTKNMLDPSDADKTVEAVRWMYYAAKGRRFASFVGVCRTARRALALDDVEDGDLIHVGEEVAEKAGDLFAWDWYLGYRLYLSANRKEAAQ